MADKGTRLEEALKAADAAGDTAAATMLAAEIQRRRTTAEGAQELPGGTAPTGAGVESAPFGQGAVAAEPDQFPGIPTEIEGQVLSPEIRKAIADARKLPEGQEKRLIAAQITGQLAFQQSQAGDGNIIDEFSASSAGTFLRGIGTGIFGLGDLAAAAGTFIGSGANISFGDSLEIQREFRRAQEGASPFAAIAGEITGAVLGGSIAVKAISKIKGTGRVASFLKNLVTFKKGQFFKSAGKAAVLGATAGGVTEGITEGEPVVGATIGAIAGPAGVVAVKGVTITAGAVKTLLESPAAAGLKILAKKLGTEADDLGRSFLEFIEATGKPPTLVELANPAVRAELRELTEQGGEAAVTIAREGAEKLLKTRAGEVAEQVKGGRVTPTEAGREAARTRQGDIQFEKARASDIKFTGKQVAELFDDPDLRKVIPASDLVAIDDIIQKAGRGKPRKVRKGQTAKPGKPKAIVLKGKVVDDIRQALNERIGAGFRTKFVGLRDKLVDVARKDEAFDRALTESGERAAGVSGVATGRKILTAATDEFEQSIEGALKSLDELAGIRGGARSALVQKAREGVSSTLQIARTLAEDSGLIQRLRAIFPAREVDKIQQIARVQAKAIENIGTVVPASGATGTGRGLTTLVNAVVLLSPGASVASKTFAAGRMAQLLKKLPGVGIGERVAANIARDMFDPTKTKAIIAVLKKAGLPDEQIFNLYAITALFAGSKAN